MPLSIASPRQPVHQRQVACQGYLRDDGLWDIEAHLTDTKSYAFSNADRGQIQAGEPVHGMWLRITVDDTLLILAVEAVTDFAPYGICPSITPNFQRLVGLRISGGFSRQVRELLGGVRGCTHLVELTGPLATTAFQTVYPSLARKNGNAVTKTNNRPLLLNTCHALAAESPVVLREWPAFYTGPDRPTT